LRGARPAARRPMARPPAGALAGAGGSGDGADRQGGSRRDARDPRRPAHRGPRTGREPAQGDCRSVRLAVTEDRISTDARRSAWPMTDEIAEDEPFAPFERWFALAAKSEPLAETMTLATATRDGVPALRAVLLKGSDRRGFVFYTNFESRKAEELTANPRAALCFHWKSLGRQIRIEGTVSVVSDEEADAYFASRPRDSQIR